MRKIHTINGQEVARSWGKMFTSPEDFVALDALAALKNRTVAKMLDEALEAAIRPILEEFKKDFVPPADGQVRRTTSRRSETDPQELAARTEAKRLKAQATLEKQEARLEAQRARLADAEARAVARQEAEAGRAAKREAELASLRAMVEAGEQPVSDGDRHDVPDLPVA